MNRYEELETQLEIRNLFIQWHNGKEREAQLRCEGWIFNKVKFRWEKYEYSCPCGKVLAWVADELLYGFG